MKKLEKLGYVRTVAKGWPGARAHTRQLIFNPDISAEDACAVANDPAPFIMRQAEQFMTEMDVMMKKKTRIKDQKQANLTPDITADAKGVDLYAQMRSEVGAELFEALVQRCGKDASLDALQAELRRMLA
jgi:hypothetical protein